MIAALLVVGAVALAAAYVCHVALKHALILGQADRDAFAEERRAWERERQILLNRIQSPETGIAQSLVDGPPAEAVSYDHEADWPRV